MLKIFSLLIPEPNYIVLDEILAIGLPYGVVGLVLSINNTPSSFNLKCFICGMNFSVLK